MADNITVDTITGSPVVATDDISSVHYQVVKLAHGAADSATLVSTASGLPVDLRASNASQAVTNAGTFATQVDGDALTALQLIDNIVVVEDEQHGSGDSGVMPLAVRNDTLAALAGTDGDYAPFQVNATGALFVQEGAAMDVSAATVTVDATGQGDVPVTLDGEAVVLGAGTAEVGSLLPPDTDVTAHSNYARKYYTASAPTDGIIWSPASGKRWHVAWIAINVSAASTVTLEDDKAGGDDPVFKAEFAANSGIFMTFPDQYPMASGEDAADLTVTASVGTVYVSCGGYEI